MINATIYHSTSLTLVNQLNLSIPILSLEKHSRVLIIMTKSDCPFKGTLKTRDLKPLRLYSKEELLGIMPTIIIRSKEKQQLLIKVHLKADKQHHILHISKVEIVAK